MTASNPDLSGLLGIDKDDLLTAMKRLTKIIQSDKQFDIPPQQQTQQFSTPNKLSSSIYQKSSPNLMSNYEDVDLAENIRTVPNETSGMRQTSEEVFKSGKNMASQQSMQYSQKSQFVSFEKRHEKSPSIVDRLYQQDNRKKEKLAAMQFQKYKEEVSALKQKPEISLNSKIIAERRNKTPIYERYLTVMKQREENINRMRKELEDKNPDLDSAATFQPDLSFTKRFNHHERSRTPQEFTNHVYAWQQKKNETIQREQYENITRELSELTFKPKINNKSRIMAKKNQAQESVESRLHKHKEQVDAKRQALLEKEKPTFRPALNERSQNMMKHRKGPTEKSYRLDKSANNSYIDTSVVVENRKTNQGRSLSPGPFVKSRSGLHTSPDVQMSPKFNEIDYTPAVDFLLKKFA